MHWAENITEAQILLAGLTPLALSCLVISSLNICINSISLLLIPEVVIAILYIIIPNTSKEIFKIFLSYKYTYKAIGLAFCWCLMFAIWATFQTPERQELDSLLINTNPDMWAYIRRFAALTTQNLAFDGTSACSFFLQSPKKLSSFIGSVIIILCDNTSLGIILFQGLLGCGLFLCLFIDWIGADQRKFPWPIKIIGLVWAISSPQIYWLLVNSYLSNTLFIIVLCLGLRACRRTAIMGGASRIEKYITLIFIIINIFSFYPAALPLALGIYLTAEIIYSYNNKQTWQQQVLQRAKTLMVIAPTLLTLYIFFKDQFLIYEVRESLNPLIEHGANFVPLNPWSLLQEKPKPMPVRKDFGVWNNIIIGTIFSVCTLQRLWLVLQQDEEENLPASIYRKDLTAGFFGVLFYLSYLIAYIPLIYTYRLGKIAISVLWPLAIFTLLPLIKWLYNKIELSKNRLKKNLLIIFMISHVILHVDKSFSQTARPSGNILMTSNTDFAGINSLVVTGCLDVHISQFYERMVGIKLARKYPDIKINVVGSEENIDGISKFTTIVTGTTISHHGISICYYEF